MSELPHNLDELVAPDWVNNQLFEKILQKSENDSQLKVTSIDIKPATKVGEHFASIMFRVKVSYSVKSGTEHSKSMIVKTQPFVEGQKKDMLTNTNIFELETKMYTKIIPEMHRLLRAVGDKTQFGPTLLYDATEPAEVLIFNDLCDDNFETSPTQIDYDGTKIVYEQIAKWHACSYHMRSDQSFNDDFEYFEGNMFNGMFGEDIIKMISTNVTSLVSIMREWPEMKKYQANLDECTKNIKERGTAAYKPSRQGDGYNVLNHSDLHFKNVMIRKEEGETVDVILLDFQISAHASPALDLAYLNFALSDENCRSNHRDELIYLYYETFSNTLKKIGYLGKIPTMIDLQVEILKHGFFQVINTLSFLPFAFMDFSKITIEDLWDSEGEKAVEFQKTMFNQEPLVSILKKYTLEFIQKGFM